MRWRLVLEYGPELRYIKGEHNIVADALSRLDLDDYSSRRHPRWPSASMVKGRISFEFPLHMVHSVVLNPKTKL
jgi:hypothetical protein